MKDNYYAVIMAGGGGTRLWPISRTNRPKQLLSLTEEKSLFQIAIERLDGLFDFDHTYIVTVENQLQDLISQEPSLSLDNFIIEPLPRGTASVVGLAAIYLLGMNKDAVMAILTADHVINNIEEFHILLENAYQIAMDGFLVTLGVEPSFPSTGYGYIKAGRNLDEKTGSFIVEKFVEKPSRNLAENYFQEGGYYWNSGMFVWRADKILVEFGKQMPQVHQKLIAILDHLDCEDSKNYIEKIWPTVEKQTIDYGIMENAQNVVVLPARGLGWSDVGSWDSLYDLLKHDDQENAVKTRQLINQDSKNILIFAENQEKIIAIIGMEDTIIVDSDDALLICKRGDSQKVKQVIEKLKKDNLMKYL